jgi:hypothetical protein
MSAVIADVLAVAADDNQVPDRAAVSRARQIRAGSDMGLQYSRCTLFQLA